MLQSLSRPLSFRFSLIKRPFTSSSQKSPKEALPRMTVAAVSFTGGKDCTYAMWKAQTERPEVQVKLLVTFGPGTCNKPFLSHPLEVVKLQSEALGLPHIFCAVDGVPSYLEAYRREIANLRVLHGVELLITGDILDVCNGFMDRACLGTGVTLWKPIWNIPRKQLLESLLQNHFRVLFSCAKKISSASKETETTPPPPNDATVGKLVGKVFSSEILSELLKDDESGKGDAAGERGEYHTMVLDGPGFRKRVAAEGIRRTSEDECFVYWDFQNPRLEEKD